MLLCVDTWTCKRVSVCAHAYVKALSVCCTSAGAIVTCGCEPPDSGTESQTPVFCSLLEPSPQAPGFVAFCTVLSFKFLEVPIKILALSSTPEEVQLMSTIPHSVFPRSILLSLCNYLNFPYGNRHKTTCPKAAVGFEITSHCWEHPKPQSVFLTIHFSGFSEQYTFTFNTF